MQTPGESIRSLRNKLGLTLSSVSSRTGLAISTLSKLEKGRISLSYDKLVTLSTAFGVDMAELLGPASPTQPVGGSGRRVVHRAGEGYGVETHSYRQLYLGTELLNKLATPLLAEVRARTIDEFIAEFGDLIHHPGEEFAFVLEGEIDFHTELYTPTRLKAGDSVYFDSDMGHAYLKASEQRCVVLAVCCARVGGHEMMEEFKTVSKRHATDSDASKPSSNNPRRDKTKAGRAA